MNDAHALRYRLSARIWKYEGASAWYFVTLPKKESDEIRFFAHERKSAWGSVRVRVGLGGSTWSTSLFPDSELDAYVLPIKAEVRRREGVSDGSEILLDLEIAL